MLKHSNVVASVIAVIAFVVCSCFNATAAQSTSVKEGQTVTITGCLQRGEAADEFNITEEYKKYDLTSTKVKLADHLDQQVTVTGKITRAPGQGGEGKLWQEGGEYAKVQVTNLKMIRTNCGQ